VTALFVEEKYRGKGLGKRALEVAGAHCRSRGIGTIELQVGGGESGGAGVLSENRI